jgi:hypothetical protein
MLQIELLQRTITVHSNLFSSPHTKKKIEVNQHMYIRADLTGQHSLTPHLLHLLQEQRKRREMMRV